MRWTPGGQSGDVEDRRGQSYGGGFRGGPASIGIILVLLVLSLLTGRNLLGLLGPGTIDSIESPSQTSGPPGDESPEEKRLFQFVDFVVGDAQNTWAQLLGNGYRRATVVVFRGATPTACGVGQSAMGPFYCPLDEKVYIDLGFYDELRRRFGAPGDFAQAYVITHETRASRAASARNRCAGASAPGTASRCGEPALGAAGTAGRLPRRGVGTFDRTAQPPRARGRRRGAQRGSRHRRRPDSELHRARSPARFLHPRVVGRARAVVPSRPRERRRHQLRYLRAGDGLGTWGHGDMGTPPRLMSLCPYVPVLMSLCPRSALPDRSRATPATPRNRQRRARGSGPASCRRPRGSSGSSTAPADRRPSPSCS